MTKLYWVITLLLLTVACGEAKKTGGEEAQPEKLKALIIDGQNNHYIWPKTTQMMQDYLEQTDLFEVEIYRMDSVWLGVKYNETRPVPYQGYIEMFPMDSTAYGISPDPVKTSDFSLDFSQYDVIVSNLGASSPEWPEETKRSFEKYVAEGGGFVVVHAASNVWGDWPAFDKMIGLGAWGDRDSTNGPYVYYTDAGEVEKDYSAGVCGSHGPEFEYVVTSREPEHPVMQGLPTEWLHTQDELYERMRGPFENATILATAYSDAEGNAPPWNPDLKGLGQHVPTIMAIDYDQGRVFHTTLGHFDYSMECVGFITTLQRGTEWAATGNVTQSIPEDFPSKEQTASRAWN